VEKSRLSKGEGRSVDPDGKSNQKQPSESPYLDPGDEKRGKTYGRIFSEKEKLGERSLKNQKKGGVGEEKDGSKL